MTCYSHDEDTDVMADTMPPVSHPTRIDSALHVCELHAMAAATRAAMALATLKSYDEILGDTNRRIGNGRATRGEAIVCDRVRSGAIDALADLFAAVETLEVDAKVAHLTERLEGSDISADFCERMWLRLLAGCHDRPETNRGGTHNHAPMALTISDLETLIAQLDAFAKELS